MLDILTPFLSLTLCDWLFLLIIGQTTCQTTKLAVYTFIVAVVEESGKVSKPLPSAAVDGTATATAILHINQPDKMFYNYNGQQKLQANWFSLALDTELQLHYNCWSPS